MLTATGRVLVLDFGIVRLALAPDDAGGTPGPGDSTVVGTAGYASPERLQGLEDERADVFAFGAVLYECLAGSRAFAGSSSEEILASVLSKDPDFARLPEETPEPIRQLIAGCLEKDPGRRIAGMDSVLALLRRGR